jgi:cell volume regulation protein A
VFAAGIALGDERAAYKREIERFHSALASLAEVIAFAMLRFTVDLDEISHTSVWVPGLVIGLGLALVVRPVVGFPLLLPVKLTGRERSFVLFAGLKGAVPLLLGTLLPSPRTTGVRRGGGRRRGLGRRPGLAGPDRGPTPADRDAPGRAGALRPRGKAPRRS